MDITADALQEVQGIIATLECGEQPSKSWSILSRVFHQNIVVAFAKPGEANPQFVVKLFRRNASSRQRLTREAPVSAFLASHGLPFRVPQVIAHSHLDHPNWEGYIIRQFAAGSSASMLIDIDIDKFIGESLPILAAAFSSIWSLPVSAFPATLGKLAELSYADRISGLKNLRSSFPSLKQIIDEVESKVLFCPSEPSMTSLCHGDPSGHEFIFDLPSLWWIDWETLGMGCPSADVGRLLHSLGARLAGKPEQAKMLVKAFQQVFNDLKATQCARAMVDRTIAIRLLLPNEPSDVQIEWSLKTALELVTR